MFPDVFAILLMVGAAVVTLLAFAKGDSAAQVASIINLVNAALLPLVRLVAGRETGEVLQLVTDFIAAVGFLLLAVRYASLWLGVTMLLQSGQFSLHAFYLVMERPHDHLHAWINNMVQWAMYICILAGVALAVRRRTMLAREEAERQRRRQKQPLPA
jgi:hypothetical protein